MNEQQQILLEHYHNPKNFGKPKSFTHYHKIQNLSCGDELEIYLNVDPKTSKVKNAHFEGEGCSIAIASASLLTQKLKGMKVSDVLILEYDDIIDLIGIVLTTSRLKCAVLGLEGVKRALK